MDRTLRDGARQAEKFSYTNWAHLACENPAKPREMYTDNDATYLESPGQNSQAPQCFK